MTRTTITEGRYTAVLSPNNGSVYAVFMIDDQVARGIQGRSYKDMKSAKRFARAAMKKAA